MRFRTLALSFAISAIGVASVANEGAPPVVKITTVNSPMTDLSRRFFGRVVAKETVDLAFQVGGQILKLPAIEGGFIEEGELVAELDLEPFQLAYGEAVASQELANRTLDRFERLRGSAVSDVEIEDAGTDAELAAISTRSAERDLEQATLTSPFLALVAERQVSNFETIAAGTSVVRLHDMSEIRIEIDVPEVLFQRAGADPDLELSATFPASDQSFIVEPREFNAETSQVGQTFTITLGMMPPEELVILPGSSAEVTATLKSVNDMPEIPTSAVVSSNDGQANVFVFEPAGADEGTITLTPVEIQPSDTGTVQIVSGLEVGQEIVATGGGRLETGMAVRRFNGLGN
ncbi:MAG: efflux RND transporter periplasmic adaptor subunit [Pseudomonadota bacterium]